MNKNKIPKTLSEWSATIIFDNCMKFCQNLQQPFNNFQGFENKSSISLTGW